jgi:16S rRNA pseudouridine516 synthase
LISAQRVPSCALMITRKLRRLDQLLSSLGYATRREAHLFLRDHEVTVDAEPLDRVDAKVDYTQVLINGEPLLAPDGLFALFHKPLGLTCTHSDREGSTIYDALPAQWSRRNPAVSSVGRLDKETSGLLLVTDQGPLIQKLTSPRSEVEKVYHVTVDRPLEDGLVGLFGAGVLRLAGEEDPCLPAELHILNELEAELTLTEGRNHQVRRMFGSQGWDVVKLHRTRFGQYTLDGLAEGQWRLHPLPS